MLILIKIEEYFRNRKIKNQKKVFEEVQKVIRKIDFDSNGSDGTISALASACDYKTLYFTLTRILVALNSALKIEKNKSARAFYKKGRSFFGFLKFILDFNGGYLGFLWL